VSAHDFKCQSCEHYFEVHASIQQGPPEVAVCPECGQDAVKDWSRAKVRFQTKGSGWSTASSKKKKERIARSNKLAVTQWEDNEPTVPVGTPRNPTKGGPFDNS